MRSCFPTTGATGALSASCSAKASSLWVSLMITRPLTRIARSTSAIVIWKCRGITGGLPSGHAPGRLQRQFPQRRWYCAWGFPATANRHLQARVPPLWPAKQCYSTDAREFPASLRSSHVFAAQLKLPVLPPCFSPVLATARSPREESGREPVAADLPAAARTLLCHGRACLRAMPDRFLHAAHS